MNEIMEIFDSSRKKKKKNLEDKKLKTPIQQKVK